MFIADVWIHPLGIPRVVWASLWVTFMVASFWTQRSLQILYQLLFEGLRSRYFTSSLRLIHTYRQVCYL